MSLIELFIYSFIQGITEFLPVSSSAHLTLLESVFGWREVGRTFVIAAHLGTLLTVIFYLRGEIKSILKDINYKKKYEKNFKLVLNIMIMTIPIIVFGFLVFKTLDFILLNLQLIAWATILGALILFISDKSKNNNKTIYDLSYKESLFIGFMQIFALIPGSSRAGMIITACRFLKISRTKSTQIVLFSGVPTIFGAVILELVWLTKNKSEIYNYQLILVTVLSSLFAYITIVYLFKWVREKSFSPFIIYRLILGTLILTIIYF